MKENGSRPKHREDHSELMGYRKRASPSPATLSKRGASCWRQFPSGELVGNSDGNGEPTERHAVVTQDASRKFSSDTRWVQTARCACHDPLLFYTRVRGDRLPGICCEFPNPATNIRGIPTASASVPSHHQLFSACPEVDSTALEPGGGGGRRLILETNSKRPSNPYSLYCSPNPSPPCLNAVPLG